MFLAFTFSSVKGLEKIILDIANLKGMHNEANKIIE
jgi:hypothetical protein